MLPVASGKSSARAGGRDSAERNNRTGGRRIEGGERLVSGVENILDGVEVIVLCNIRVKRSTSSMSHAETHVPGVSGPDAVRDEDGAGNTVVIEVVKLAILSKSIAMICESARAIRIIGSSLEGGDAGRIKSRTVDVVIHGERGKFVSESIEVKMTTKNVAEADLTRVSTSLDGVEGVFVESELRNESLRASGDRKDGNVMIQDERTDSEMNFVARGSLNPKVVAGGIETAMVDDNRVVSIKGTVNCTGGKRRDVSSRNVAVADAVVVIITVPKIIDNAFGISQESLKGERSIRPGSVREDLKLKVTINAEARSNVNIVDLVVSIVGVGE
jgi:hypothetical protein